ncbi:MAG: HAD-IIA family hydrolase [Anaerolineales bacterium]|nr:HAD-IIA family hydrolase [Anaerolineales bacterium]
MLPANIQALILDMDGVLWRADQPIGDLPAVFARLAERGLKVALATNNSTRTPQQYVERLQAFGVSGLEPWQVVTSSLAVADLLQKRFPDGGQVFVVGEIGLIEALGEAGFDPVTDPDYTGRPVAVAGAVDREITFWKLSRATLLIRSGVPFYFTNPDRTFPTPEGLIPGAGALLAALVAASDVEPVVAGKPAAALLELACQRLGTRRSETLVVGDRLETDILGGQNAGMPVALVLSGVSTPEMAAAWRPPIDLLAPDLATLVGI